MQAYLEFERTNGDPSRLQILYEDAITEIPASADLLPNYTEYLHGTLKVFPFKLSFLFNCFFYWFTNEWCMFC